MKFVKAISRELVKYRTRRVKYLKTNKGLDEMIQMFEEHYPENFYTPTIGRMIGNVILSLDWNFGNVLAELHTINKTISIDNGMSIPLNKDSINELVRVIKKAKSDEYKPVIMED